ncbi:MAG: transporter substrate-binding domain-containing protein [Candidatus Gastranaerophilales bacterium]|nr:transporter substrate-binding domain-containing protein [Candidatus Gastranaerophilales bacterium]
MKNIIKILLLILVCFTFCSCTQKVKHDNDLISIINDRKIFKVGINDGSKPFAYRNEKGELIGFDVELIKEISKKIFGTDKIVEFHYLTPSNRILSLNSNEVDVVISTMTINQERLRIVDFSKPYFQTGQAILVPKNSNIRSGKDLANKTIGIVLGTTASSNIKYISPTVNIKGFRNYKFAFDELQKGNIDAISTDDVILQGIVSDYPDYKILQDRYSTEFYGIALRKDIASQTLKQEINSALTELERKGKLLKIEKKYDINYRR